MVDRPKLLRRQNELGQAIISKINRLTSRYDKSEFQEVAIMWLKFYSIYQKLKRCGIRSEEYYSEIEAAIIQIQDRFPQSVAKEDDKKTGNPVDEGRYSDQIKDQIARFLRDVKDFKEFLTRKEMELENCPYPDIVLDELKLRFGIIKETSRRIAPNDDEVSQQAFCKLITKYFDVLLKVREQIQKKAKKMSMKKPANTKTISRESKNKPYVRNHHTIWTPVKVNAPLQGLLEFRPIARRDQLLENHIRNINDGVALKTVNGATVTLNHFYPGCSEEAIRRYYSCRDIPSSLKQFITPLMEQTT